MILRAIYPLAAERETVTPRRSLRGDPAVAAFRQLRDVGEMVRIAAAVGGHSQGRAGGSPITMGGIGCPGPSPWTLVRLLSLRSGAVSRCRRVRARAGLG